jgi:hypothetical protein
MSALFIGHTASLAALEVSLLIIPLIAVAAKLTYDRARRPPRDEFPRHRAGDQRSRGHEDRSRDRVVMHDRFKAKLEATIWPD